MTFVVLGVLAAVAWVAFGRRGRGSRSGPAAPGEGGQPSGRGSRVRAGLWVRLSGHGGSM